MARLFLPFSGEQLRTTPAIFWLLSVPTTVAVLSAYVILLKVRSRRGVIMAIVLQIVIFGVSYWSEGWISTAINRAYGY